MDFFVSIFAGIIGGNITAGLLKNHNLGLWLNTVLGVCGGIAAWHLLNALGFGGVAHHPLESGALDQVAVATQAASAAVVGGLFVLCATFVRNAVVK
ncbi:MAG: hypothetical protein AAGA97_02310 [Pseudomonadota bacterium]